MENKSFFGCKQIVELQTVLFLNNQINIVSLLLKVMWKDFVLQNLAKSTNDMMQKRPDK